MDTNTTGLSAGDLALLKNNGGEGSWIWFLLIFVLLGWGGIGGGRGAAPAPNLVTQSEMQNALNNQSLQAQMNQLGLATQQNNYETAQLINGQTNAMLQQNNTNLINAIQGFNNLSQQVAQQTNVLGSKLDQLGYQMDQCCCSIKTQMLNDRLEDRNRELAVAQNALNNAQQTQTILTTAGRWVGWSGSGTQAASVVSS